MKLYRVKHKYKQYDEYNSCIIAANNINEINKMFRCYNADNKNYYAIIQAKLDYKTGMEYLESVYEDLGEEDRIIEEISLNEISKPQVLMSSESM